jgi:hypothetical protein
VSLARPHPPPPHPHTPHPLSPRPFTTQNKWIDNVVAYIDSYALHNGYGGTVGTPGNGMRDQYADQFVGNTVVLPKDGTYALPLCQAPGKTLMANNTLYTPTGNVRYAAVEGMRASGGVSRCGYVPHALPPTPPLTPDPTPPPHHPQRVRHVPRPVAGAGE